MGAFLGPGTTEDSYKVDSSRSMGLGTPLRKAPWNFMRKFGRPSPGPAGRPGSAGEGEGEPSSPSNRLASEERGKASPPGVPLSSPGGSATSPGPVRGPSLGSAMLTLGPSALPGLQGNREGSQAAPASGGASRKPPPTWVNSPTASCFKATVVVTGVWGGYSQMCWLPAPGRGCNNSLFQRPGNVSLGSATLGISWRRITSWKPKPGA